MKKLCTLLLLWVWMLTLALPVCAETVDVTKEAATITLAIGKAAFTATLEQNETANAFFALLPTELSMSELNGNEKYIYLDTVLPSAAERVGRIEAGDLMLYGDSCVVLFYKSFDTAYSYTRIGHIDDVTGLAEAVGGGSVTVDFLMQSGAPVIVDIGGLSFPGTLRNNTPGSDLLSRLPYTAVLSRAEVDFCGDAGDPFAYEETDWQQGFEYGDLLFVPEGNWLCFFVDGMDTYGDKQRLVLGHMDCDMESLRALTGEVTVTIRLAE